MKPALPLLVAVAVWMGIGVIASIWHNVMFLCWIAGALILALAGADFFIGFFMKRPSVERHLPTRFASGVPGDVTLEVRNQTRTRGRFTVFDGIPPESDCEIMPWEGEIAAGGFARIDYPITLLQRGQLPFADTYVARRSPLGFWDRSYRVENRDEAKVFPNYEPVLQFSLLAMDNREDQMGIVHKNRIGMSREFHQLREYHDGDSLPQVDWKATSRRMELISREYREQKNQTVVFLVDCGRRLRAIDAGIPQFDHCLNALLLMAFVALRQADHVGVLSFGGTERWLPPVKGPHAMPALLNHVYDYETTLNPSDFTEGVNRLMHRQRRRALVVALTNLRSEDVNDVLPALKLLRRRHLVVLASLREEDLDKAKTQPVEGLDSALRVCYTRHYLDERRLVLERLNAAKIITVDATARKLPIELTNKYLEIKESGML